MKFKEIIHFIKKIDNFYNTGLDFNFFSEIISICEKNKKFLRISEYETSIPFNSVIYPRFVHYILCEKEIFKKKSLNLFFAYRGPEILKNAGILKGYEIFKSFINILLKNNIEIPYTIVSVEFEKNKIIKFTEYFCFRNIDYQLSRILSDFIEFNNPEFIYKNSRNITFIGIDYFPENNNILLKLYNKWKFNEKLLYGYEKKFLEKYNLNYVKDLARTTYIYPDGRFELNKKTHFIFKRKEKFNSFLNLFEPQNHKLINKLDIFKKNKIVISMNKKVIPLEIYIK